MIDPIRAAFKTLEDSCREDQRVVLQKASGSIRGKTLIIHIRASIVTDNLEEALNDSLHESIGRNYNLHNPAPVHPKKRPHR